MFGMVVLMRKKKTLRGIAFAYANSKEEAIELIIRLSAEKGLYISDNDARYEVLTKIQPRVYVAERAAFIAVGDDKIHSEIG